MKSAMFLFFCAALFSCAAMAQTGFMPSSHIATDFAPNADPNAPQWRDAPKVIAPNNPLGSPEPAHRTEIRSRWTDNNLHFLFICPFEQLYPKPGQPETTGETNKLWDYDVAEVFIGWDWNNINRYKEFEISPRGEWVDLDIDRLHPLQDSGIHWDSGFQLKTRIDESKKIWYGEFSIPWKSIAPEPPKAGQRFRLNLYRIQGPPPDRTMIAWQKTGARNYHVPEAFGTLRLEGK
jgi:hypothetical protein